MTSARLFPMWVAVRPMHLAVSAFPGGVGSLSKMSEPSKTAAMARRALAMTPLDSVTNRSSRSCEASQLPARSDSLSHDVFGALVVTDAEEPGVPQAAVLGPLGEADLHD